ncbi:MULTISPECIES: DUF2946 family protein [unclassified Methylocystis]|nr:MULTISPECIES: DUF2946 family protein [unclassified Methylocystis]MBL1255755.1 hypothetical protein [Methylocystis sp. Sn-Cys]MDJ0450047.1 hypothetical protein [Methylocystis sp. JR02]
MRDIGERIRVAIVIAAVWALMFGVSASGAAVAGATDTVLKNNDKTAVGLFACFKRHMTQRADAASDKAPGTDYAGKHHCPCCLAASMAAAVLPERLAPVTRPLQAQRPVSYSVAATFARDGCSSPSINGARAPPSIV